MSPEPPEPPCPPDRKPHRDRVKEIDALLPEGKTGAIIIDDTPEHRAWYFHELEKYSRLMVVAKGIPFRGGYVIKVRKEPSRN